MTAKREQSHTDGDLPVALSVNETAPSDAFESGFWELLGHLYLQTNDPGASDAEARKANDDGPIADQP